VTTTSKVVVALALLAATSTACGSDGATPAADDTAVRHLVPRVVATHPHDPDAFTQGLELVDGRLYETTGRYGMSGLREVDRATGRVLRHAPIDDALFGEGFTSLGDGRGVQLTWKAGRALVWDLASLETVATFAYGGQGWGLCRLDDGTLAMSDGSAVLTLREPEAFRRVGEVKVWLDGDPVARLNELECVGSTVWANVWLTDRIVGIDLSLEGTPDGAAGRVTAVVDASGLVADRSGFGPDDVLNGIAHDPETGRFLLAGKRWPVLYEVEFVPIGD